MNSCQLMMHCSRSEFNKTSLESLKERYIRPESLKFKLWLQVSTSYNKSCLLEISKYTGKECVSLLTI